MVLKSAVVLLVEDDPADVELTQYTIAKSKVWIDLHTVGDGVEALAFLRREGKYADAPRPDLILLDLNMPRMDGREFLSELRANSHIKAIPVVVLTTSQTDEDIFKSYELGANCYITKPVGLAEFAKVVGAVEEFWFTVVRLPKPPGDEPA
jgi:two-component system, chemotaxis family, response regulator Rcp1